MHNEPEKRLSKVAENSTEAETNWNQMNGVESDTDDFENADDRSDIRLSSERHAPVDQERVQNPDEGFLSEEDNDIFDRKYFLSCAERRHRDDQGLSNECMPPVRPRRKSMATPSSCQEETQDLQTRAPSSEEIGSVGERVTRLSMRTPSPTTVDRRAGSRQQRESSDERRTGRRHSYDRSSVVSRNSAREADVMNRERWPHDKFRPASGDRSDHRQSADAQPRYGRTVASYQTDEYMHSYTANRFGRENRGIDQFRDYGRSRSGRAAYLTTARGGRQPGRGAQRGRFDDRRTGLVGRGAYGNEMTDSYGHSQRGFSRNPRYIRAHGERDTASSYTRRGNVYSASRRGNRNSTSRSFRGGTRGQGLAGGGITRNRELVPLHSRQASGYVHERRDDVSIDHWAANGNHRGRYEKERNEDFSNDHNRYRGPRQSFREPPQVCKHDCQYQESDYSSVNEPSDERYKPNTRTKGGMSERNLQRNVSSDRQLSRGSRQVCYDGSGRKGTQYDCGQDNTKPNECCNGRPASSTAASARYSTQSQNKLRKFNPGRKGLPNTTIKPPRFNKQRNTRNVSESSNADATAFQESAGTQRTYSHSKESKGKHVPRGDAKEVKSSDERPLTFASGSQLIIGTQPSLPAAPKQVMTKEADSNANNDGHLSSHPFIQSAPAVGRVPLNNQLATTIFPPIGLINLASLSNQPAGGVQHLYYLTPQGLASAVVAQSPHQLGLIDPCQNQLLVNAPIQMTSLQPHQQHQLAASSGALPAGQHPNSAWTPHQSGQMIYPSHVAPHMDQSRNPELMVGYQQPIQQLQAQLATPSHPPCVLGACTEQVQPPAIQQPFLPNGEYLAQANTQVLSTQDTNRAAYIQSAIMQQQQQATDPQFLNFHQNVNPRQPNDITGVSNHLGQQMFGNARQVPNNPHLAWNLGQPRQRAVAPLNPTYNSRYDSYSQRAPLNQNRVATFTDQVQYLGNSNVVPQLPLLEQGQITDASTVTVSQINSNTLQ